MKMKNWLPPRKRGRGMGFVGPSDSERVVHQLRVAAAFGAQGDAHRQRIRAATQC